MKTKKLFYRMVVAFIAVLLCLSVSGCGGKEEKDTTQVSSNTQNADLPSQEEDTQLKQNTVPAVEVSTPEMCWACGQVPVSGSSNYCANCKCMICNSRRKSGNYMYCSLHNCSVSGCAAMVVDNSQYCISHKCAMPGCKIKVWPGSQYCAIHK